MEYFPEKNLHAIFKAPVRAALNLKVRLTLNSETDVTVFEWTWNCGGETRKGYGKKNRGKAA